MHLTYLLCASVWNSRWNAAEMLLLLLATCWCVRCCVSVANCSGKVLVLLDNVAKQAAARNQPKGKVVGVAGFPVQERGAAYTRGERAKCASVGARVRAVSRTFCVLKSDQKLLLSVGASVGLILGL